MNNAIKYPFFMVLGWVNKIVKWSENNHAIPKMGIISSGKIHTELKEEVSQ